MMNNVRSKRSDTRYGGQDTLDYAFNQYAGAFKMLGPILGKATVLGPLTTAVDVGLGALVAVYNDSAATAFVASGTSAVAVASVANGYAIPPNSYIIIATGEDGWVRGSGATVYGYKIKEDLEYNPKSGLSTI